MKFLTTYLMHSCDMYTTVRAVHCADSTVKWEALFWFNYTMTPFLHQPKHLFIHHFLYLKMILDNIHNNKSAISWDLLIILANQLSLRLLL